MWVSRWIHCQFKCIKRASLFRLCSTQRTICHCLWGSWRVWWYNSGVESIFFRFWFFDFLIFFWKKLKIQWKKDGVDYSQIFCQADRSDGCTNYDGWFVCHCSECGLISFCLQFFCERILMKAKLWSQNQKKLFKYYNCRFLTKRLSYLEFMFSSAVFDKITL